MPMAVATILEQIIEHKRQEIAAAREICSLADLEIVGKESNQARGFEAALRERIENQKIAVIAEIKKASPSKGLIRKDFQPADHARDYQVNGATCLSIITDEMFFQGSEEYLRQARVASTLPVIRKDFMIDVYQIAEAKAMSADCILLIAAALEQAQMLELENYTQELGMDVLVEVHNRQELDRALELETNLIGINNRNLHTFITNLQTTIELAHNVPEDKLIITESGIQSVDDVRLMTDNKIFGFLIGESCMRAEHPGEKLRELMFKNE
jgi:indole-3-glycerol phosphate synthase